MSEFTEHLHEVFTLYGPASARKMSGLAPDDTLHLKAAASNRDQFPGGRLARPLETR
ncbi:MAG TPA: hypothetical protein VLB10_03475 [Gammaproteobacteria bacterium]|jgi:hypothetical protein|nr:hypothetical protein [Gammaproteobacteria bacterium]